jgi:hypothetical protein
VLASAGRCGTDDISSVHSGHESRVSVMFFHSPSAVVLRRVVPVNVDQLSARSLKTVPHRSHILTLDIYISLPQIRQVVL